MEGLAFAGDEAGAGVGVVDPDSVVVVEGDAVADKRAEEGDLAEVVEDVVEAGGPVEDGAVGCAGGVVAGAGDEGEVVGAQAGPEAEIIVDGDAVAA